jgi:phosphoserine phosphatase RsbU/P
MPTRSPTQKSPFDLWLKQFWQRITQGLELNQLWWQFRADARASYQLYSKDIEFARPQGMRKGRHFFKVAEQFFWAILEQFSPARRVLLLVALVFLMFGGVVTWRGHAGQAQTLDFDMRFLGELLLLLLLILEVGDRVVMKRDLEIAREIQLWLLPAAPPHVPGLSIAFATRPANTVAGDYHDVFQRSVPSGDSAGQTFLLAVADVAGKSIPAALLMSGFQASLKTLSATVCSLVQLIEGMNHYTCANSQGGLGRCAFFAHKSWVRGKKRPFCLASQPRAQRSGALERIPTFYLTS